MALVAILFPEIFYHSLPGEAMPGGRWTLDVVTQPTPAPYCPYTRRFLFFARQRTPRDGQLTRSINRDALYIQPEKVGVPIGENTRSPDTPGIQRGSVFVWTDEYLDAHLHAMDEGDGMVVPVMPLKRVKIPSDTVQLNIFEPRYRLMFRLVKRAKSRVFGVSLKTNKMGMATVGALCEMTHCIPVPEKKTLFISARVIGRFKINQVVHWKPFVAMRVRRQYDIDGPCDAQETEENIWNDMMLVRNMVDSLTETGLSDDAFSLEVRRYSLDRATRDSVKTPAGSHPDMIDASKRAGLMGSYDEGLEYDERVEFICSEATASKEEQEQRRREHFSFALARTLEFHETELQDLLFMERTETRLKHCHGRLREAMKYVIARKSLKDL